MAESDLEKYPSKIIDLGRYFGNDKWLSRMTRFSRRIWDAVHRSCPSLVGDGRKMQIDSEWLAAFDEALLALFAIDHADAGMDREELGWY